MRKLAFCLFILANLLLVFKYTYGNFDRTLSFITTICYLSSIALLFPYSSIKYYIFDPEEYKPNKTKESLILKLRFRALLLNNLSVLILIIISTLTFIGFYFLVSFLKFNKDTEVYKAINQIGISILLILLVNVFFRVFKYILRIAAFYNAKADAIEYQML